MYVAKSDLPNVGFPTKFKFCDNYFKIRYDGGQVNCECCLHLSPQIGVDRSLLCLGDQI